MVSGEKLRAYPGERLHAIPVYLQPGDATVVHSNVEIQHHLSVTGTIVEIGVLSGKTFALLALSLKDGEVAIAIDPIETPDRSDMGCGDFELYANLPGNIHQPHDCDIELRGYSALVIDVDDQLSKRYLLA